MTTMYGIQRSEKYKRQDIAGIQAEATRTAKHYNNDVDINKSQYNITLIDCSDWMQKINDTIADTGVKVRKDSVLVIGGVYTATGEFFNRQAWESRQEWQEKVLGYFNDCLDWHIKTYCQGNRDLVLSAVIHQDETTLHLQTYSMPIIDRGNGKYALSAKTIMGNKKDYTNRVDSFYNDVSKKYGLERGERTPEGQKAKKHIETQKYKLLKMQQELTEAKAELTNIEHDKIIADFDKMELDQQIRIAESKNQKLHQEYKNMQQQMKQMKTEISTIKNDKEIYEFDKNALLMENKKLRESKKNLQSQNEELNQQINDKQLTCNEITEDMAKKLDLAKKLNKIIDELADKYEDDYQLIDESLQITNMLQEEYADIYEDLQSKLNNPVAELYVDDEEIEL